MCGKSARSTSPRPRAAVSLLAATLLFVAGTVILPQLAIAADKKPDTTKKDDPPKSDKDQAIDQQAKAWTAFYSGKYEDAIKLCDPLLKSQDSAQEAVHCQARACWAIGTQKSCGRAMQIWGKFPKPVIIGVVTERLNISKALAAIGEKNDKSATQTLEGAMTDGIRDTCTAEAAIELAKLYVKAQKFDDAQKALTFGKSMLEKQVKATEMAAAKAAPFLSVIGKAIDHLAYDKDAGREPFENAQALQRDKKFTDAAKVYQQVVKDFADTDYAPRSQVSLGYCMVGLKEPNRAVEHWKKFISALPAGPWRAQAYIATIDLYLEELLDLAEAGKQVAIARDSMDSAMTDEKASPSWKAAEADIHLRLGMVSLLQGKGENAAASFEKALAAAGDNAQLKQGLAMLVETAKTGKAVIPADVGGVSGTGVSPVSNEPGASATGTNGVTGLKPGDKPALALAIGTIYNATGSYETAMAIFDRVLGSQIKGATPAQLAYATFGNGASLQGQSKPDQAKATFLASLKAFPSGTWHDETLYRVAMIIQDDADKKFGQPAVTPTDPAKVTTIKLIGGTRPAGPDKSNVQPPKLLTPAEREKQNKTPKERLADLLKAKSEALPYWQELLKRYSSTGPDGKVVAKSPRVAPAMYNVGVMQYDTGEVGSTDKAEQMFKDAATTLSSFCEAYPMSPYAGDAYARQIDISLERIFDLKVATALAERVRSWIQTAGDGSQRPGLSDGAPQGQLPMALPVWGAAQSSLSAPALKRIKYECGLRAALIAYLGENYDTANSDLHIAGAVELTDKPTKDFTLEGVGLSLLAVTIQKKRVVWRDDAIQAVSNDRQKTAIKLADLYLFVQRPDKTIEIYTRFLAEDPFLGKIVPAAKSYAMMQLAWAYRNDPTKVALAKEYLQGLLDPSCANLPWVPFGLVRLGALDFGSGTFDKAMTDFDCVVKRYPQSDDFKRALYFYAIAASKAGKFDLAKAACQQFLDKYPKDIWANHLRTLMAEITKKTQSTQNAN